jgi:aldose 1-epimerase
MFSIVISGEAGAIKAVLKDTATSTVAEILPACGAILHAFIVDHNGYSINVIDGYDDVDDFKNNCTSKGFKSCKLSPFVCRLKNGWYPFGQSTYHIHKFYLGENALHGLLYEAVFIVTDQYADATKASLTMKHEYRAEDMGYPFNYDCMVTYELTEGNSLAIITEIINKDEAIIPVCDGWHPYFTFGGKIDDLQLEFQSKSMLEFDEQLIPTGRALPYQDFGSLKKIGEASFDNCFVLDQTECQPLCVLRDVAQKIQIEIRPGHAYPYLQIYTPGHRNSIAIENLSAAPDAFNNGMGLTTLAPGAAASFKTTYKIRSLL